MGLGAVVEDRIAVARERAVIVLVATAHAVSHFYLLFLIALLPLLKAYLHVSYVELGLAITFGSIVSAAAQVPISSMVDRYGSRKMLIGALGMHGLIFGSLALIPTLPWLLLIGAVNGLAQCVYHPADYDILNGAVAKQRVGRAFSYHTFSGYVGAALAPPILIGVATHVNLQAAFLVGALPGLLTAGMLVFAPMLDAHTSASARAASGAAPVPLRQIATPAVIGLTVFFAMLNLSMSALQNFGGPALIKLYNIPLAFATGALTAYLVGVAVGVLGGGYIADMTKHHGKVASIGFAFTAFITLALAVASLGPIAIIAAFAGAGLCSGLIMPSRDMMVREAATPGAVGRTFGFVTFGFNFGGMIGPIMYGYLLDRNMPREMLLLAFCFMLAAITMPLAGEWLRARRESRTAVPA